MQNTDAAHLTSKPYNPHRTHTALARQRKEHAESLPQLADLKHAMNNYADHSLLNTSIGTSGQRQGSHAGPASIYQQFDTAKPSSLKHLPTKTS